MKKFLFCICAMFLVCNLYAQEVKPFYLQSGKYYNIESMFASNGDALPVKDNPGNWLHFYSKNANEHILEIIEFGPTEKIVSQYVVSVIMPVKGDRVAYVLEDAKDYSFVDCFEIDDEIVIMRFFNNETRPREEKYFRIGRGGYDYNEVKKMYSF